MMSTTIAWTTKSIWIGPSSGSRRSIAFSKNTGTFWLAIGDEYAAELKIEAQKWASIAATGSSGITRSACIARTSSRVRMRISFIL